MFNHTYMYSEFVWDREMKTEKKNANHNSHDFLFMFPEYAQYRIIFYFFLIFF